MVEAGLTAALAELCAEQMLTVPAVAAMMIVALSVFVNFISFPSGLLFYPGRVETRSSRDPPRKSLRRLVRASGLFDLEIALSVVSANVQLLELVRPG